METHDIMTDDPCFCIEATTAVQLAQMMLEHDCGEIPVCDEQGRPIGVVTDRDICCRVVARGVDPRDVTAKECMTAPAITVLTTAAMDECCKLMAQYRIRRVPVVDTEGRLCGIVAQADVARTMSEQRLGAMVRKVSQPGRAGTAVPGRSHINDASRGA